LGNRLLRRVLAGLVVAEAVGACLRDRRGRVRVGAVWGSRVLRMGAAHGAAELVQPAGVEVAARGGDELTLEVVVQEESIRNNPAAVEMSEVADMVAQAVEGSGPPVPEAIFGGRNSDNSSALLNHMSSGGECESDGGDSRGAYQSLDTTHSPGRV